jgi:hypothetical protein
MKESMQGLGERTWQGQGKNSARTRRELDKD